MSTALNIKRNLFAVYLLSLLLTLASTSNTDNLYESSIPIGLGFGRKHESNEQSIGGDGELNEISIRRLKGEPTSLHNSHEQFFMYANEANA